MVGGGINTARWSTYLRDIKRYLPRRYLYESLLRLIVSADGVPRVLRPGGWVQMIECYFMCQSDNGSLTDSHPLRRWSNAYIQSLDGIKDPRVPMRLKSLFHAAGFEGVESEVIQMPLCGWPDGMMRFPAELSAFVGSKLQCIWEMGMLLTI